MSHAATHPATGDGHGSSHAVDHDHGHGHGPAADLSAANIAGDGWGSGLAVALVVAGLIALAATAAYPFVNKDATAGRHAITSYHVGWVVSLGMCLGPLFLVMVLHLVKAGWAMTLRRLAENIASAIPVTLVLFIPTIFFSGTLLNWMNLEHAGDPSITERGGYMTKEFFFIRMALYFVVWIGITFRLNGLSRQQDRTGDKWLTNKMSFFSAGGILVLGLVTTIASFDLVIGVDYHWFSTMFGVVFFAGAMLTGLCLVVLLAAALRSAGKLKGLVTAEHFHDLGKLILSFTVFWAYVSFSQYFLIWYANVPEETAWFAVRQQGAWMTWGQVLIFGHFVLPFLLLLFRATKRVTALLCFVAVWQIVMYCVEIFWMIRPVVFPPHVQDNVVVPGAVGFDWVDITGLLGPVCLVLAAAVWKTGHSALIPVNDPRLPEAIAHKNYV